MAAVCLVLLPEHGAAVARYVYHQLALAPLWFAPLPDHRHQPQQLAPRPAHPRRRLAQQPSSLYGFGAPGLLLVGNRYHLLHPEDSLLVRHRLGSAQSPDAFVDPRPTGRLIHHHQSHFNTIITVISELLTRPPWETAQNQMNGEADNAVSFCIVAVSSGLSCTSRRKVLTELASHPHWAWVFAYQGADQNLSAF